MASEVAPERVNKRLRLLQIMQILRQEPCSVHDLARRLYPRASQGTRTWLAIERAIQRDLNDLETWEPLFVKVPGRPPLYHIPLSRPALSSADVVVLHAAARLLACRSNDPAQVQAVRGLTQLLPPPLREVLQRFGGTAQALSPQESHTLTQTVAAWEAGHPLRFGYCDDLSRASWRTQVAEPYLIDLHPQTLNLRLTARVPEGGLQIFMLSQMRDVQVQRGQRYQIPASFGPAALRFPVAE